MASTKKSFPRQIGGGLNQGVQPHLLPENDWYDLRNMRPDDGAMTQTEPFVLLDTFADFTEDETDYKKARWFGRVFAWTGEDLTYLWLNQRTARVVYDLHTTPVQVQVPMLVRETEPTYDPDAADTGELLAVSNGGLNITTGYALYVKIQSGGTQFKWAIAATEPADWSLVTDIKDISVGLVTVGSAFKLYFLADPAINPYTAGDLWVFRKVKEWADDDTVARIGYIRSADDVYFAGIEGKVWRYCADGYIRQVGYRTVYGRHVEIFYNHLIVGGFSWAGSSSLDARFRVGWSSLDDPDNFSPYLLTSEADEYDVTPSQNYLTPVLGITGLGVLNNTCYIYTCDAIYAMQYVGLPNVMNIQKISQLGSIFSNGLVKTPRGHYFIDIDNFYFFDGFAQPVAIGGPIKDYFFDNYLEPTENKWDALFNFYDERRGEVSWIYFVPYEGDPLKLQCRQLTYQEGSQRWFVRNLPSDTSDGEDIGMLTYRASAKSMEYAAADNLKLYRTYDADEGDAVTDIVPDTVVGPNADTYDVDGTVLVNIGEILLVPCGGVPGNGMVETGDFVYGSHVNFKELESLFMDAGWQSGQYVGVLYNVRSLASDELSEWIFAGFWYPTLQEGRLSLPRVAGRVFRFRFVFVSENYVTAGAVLKTWSEIVYGASLDVEK